MSLKELKLNLRSKILLIPLIIIALTFFVMSIFLVKLTVSTGYATKTRGYSKQILTGLTLMSNSDQPSDAFMGLEGDDDVLARDLMKQLESLGLYFDFYITGLDGKVIFAKDENEKIEFDNEFGDEFISLINGSPTRKDFIRILFHDEHIIGFTPVFDVETPKGFIVFAIDTPEELKATALALLGSIEDHQENVESNNSLLAENDSEHNLLKELVIILVSIMVPSLIILFVLLGSTYRNIKKPVNLLLDAFENLSDGNLTQEVQVSTRDEMNQLATVFNRTVQRLHDMVDNVSNSSGSVAVSASQLSSASAEINENAQSQTEKTAQSASSMDELNSSFTDVARNTANAAESAKDAAGLASNGGEIVTRTVEGMNRISRTVNDSASNVGALGKRSEEIGEIIKVINDIAGQTNLLALNAAIEAARAGEQGRGFAVVADEVRKLAERTTSATNEIAEMIKGIQDDTGKAVESMQAGTKEVEEGVSLANEAGKALQEIVTSVENVTEMMQHVATAAEQQSSTGQEISANIESVAEITKHTADAVRSSSETTSNLDLLAQELQKVVGGFKL